MKMRKLLGLLLICATVFSSCGNGHEDLYDPNAIALIKANEYAKAFVKEFGEIDPNHTWGFGDALESRGANLENNGWYKYVSIPTQITSAEEEKVTAIFQDVSNYVNNTQVDFSDFFVQHVHTGEESYDSYNNGAYDGTVLGSEKMNQLSVGANKSSLENIPNFNAGGKANEQQVWISDNQADCYYEGIALMINSSTMQFSYQNSYDENVAYYDYIMLEIDGAYYVGFDFKSDNVIKNVKADGVYDDWIIKLTPAKYLDKYRIVAEDLGTTDDFDFNDVVFDVKFVQRWDKYPNHEVAEITLLAAGGTLPLYICSNSEEIEVHGKFGVETNVMVNTGSGPVCDKITFDLIGCTNLSDIKVKVIDENAEYYLTTNVGDAPQLICVGTDFVPTKERQNIKDKYPNFVNYTNDEDSGSWY